MARSKIHELDKLFHTLTNQLSHIEHIFRQLAGEVGRAHHRVDQLRDRIIPVTFIRDSRD